MGPVAVAELRRLARTRAESQSNGMTHVKVVQAQTLQRWRLRLFCTLCRGAAQTLLALLGRWGIAPPQSVPQHMCLSQRASSHMFAVLSCLNFFC